MLSYRIEHDEKLPISTELNHIKTTHSLDIVTLISVDLDDAMENAQEFLDYIVAYYIDENIELPKPIDLVTYKRESEFKDCEFINILVRANPLRFVQKKEVKFFFE